MSSDHLKNKDLNEAIRGQVLKTVDIIINQYHLNHHKDDIVDRFINSLDFNSLYNRRKKNNIPDEHRCQGRKMDGCQCSRRCKLNTKYCGSHLKNLPYGYINDGMEIKQKEKGKRGRKKKGESDDKKKYFIETWIDSELGEKYLIDKHNLVYKNDMEYPELIGIKQNGTIFNINEVPSVLFE